MLHSTATDSLFSLLFALCNLQMKGFTAVFFSGFYPPKSRVKIGLIPPSWSFLSLPHFHQLPSKNNLGQNAVQMSKCTMRIDVTTTGKVSNKFVLHRIQRKHWSKKDQYNKYIPPIFHWAQAEPTMYRDRSPWYSLRYSWLIWFCLVSVFCRILLLTEIV